MWKQVYFDKQKAKLQSFFFLFKKMCLIFCAHFADSECCILLRKESKLDAVADFTPF